MYMYSLAPGHGHAAVAALVLVAAAPDSAASADVADPPLLRDRLFLPVGRVAFPAHDE